MKESLLMLFNYVKNPKEVGAIAVSSKYLAHEIIKNIDFKHSKQILELGPGLGIFTKAILHEASPDAQIICFEVNKRFCTYLNKNLADRRLIVVHGSAENIRKKLRQFHVQKADCIVSGLPFRNFSEKKQKKVLMEIKNALRQRGRFILFQYTNNLKEMLDVYFNNVQKIVVPLKIPPCFVYVCKN